MTDSPSVDQLLEAVAAFLREQVAPASAGRIAFHARVAANALDIARRELRIAPQAQADEVRRLCQLLDADASAGLAELNRRLCARIADGALAADSPALVAHLRQTTRDKLAIDQPGYAQDIKDGH